jgi:hypothetical protein
MYIASQKKKENIAEYILYMWQIEDIIRAYQLNIDLIIANIIKKFQLSPDKEKELTEWYESLIEMMRSENIQQEGHLQINKNVIIDLTDLHHALLSQPNYPEYNTAYHKAISTINELKTKQNNSIDNDIEVCLSFMYGVLLLKLQKKELSEGTLKAKDIISEFLIQLSIKYNAYKADKLDLE